MEYIFMTWRLINHRNKFPFYDPACSGLHETEWRSGLRKTICARQNETLQIINKQSEMKLIRCDAGYELYSKTVEASKVMGRSENISYAT
jgi:hypothetical protein